MRLIPVAVLLASSGAFAIRVPTGTPNFDLNINILAQARAVGSWNGDGPRTAPPVTGTAAPNGAFDTDFYVRRMRLITSGTAFQHWVFYLMIDNPNFGIRGNYTSSAFVQDLHIGYEFEPGFAIEGGFIYMPLSHLAINSSAGTSALEKGTAIIFYNNARGLRETGVHVRGLFLDKRIFFRGGIFNGLHGQQGADPTGVFAGPVVNPHGVPLFAGMLRYNFIGSETGYGMPTLYMDGKTRVSVGVGAQYQTKGSNTPVGVVNPATGIRTSPATAVNNYLALAADLFVNIALPGDQEFDAQVDFYRFDWGPGSDKTGYGATYEFGYRIGKIEPQVNGYWFNSESKQGNFLKFAGGLNWFFEKHQSRIGAELWFIKSNVNWDNSSFLNQILVQYQANF
jgi:hypothetical protein